MWGNIYYVDFEGQKREGDPEKVRFEKAENRRTTIAIRFSLHIQLNF